MAAGNRAYRGSTRLLAIVTATAVVGAGGLLGAVVFTSWLTTVERVVLTALVVGPIGWLLVRAWRSTTTVTSDHVTARGLLSTKRVRWTDVQDIQVEANPGAFAANPAPSEMLVVYLNTGRTLVLPHVNQMNLVEHNLDFRHEVGAIRDAWIRGRGPMWTLNPQVRRKAAERARYGMSSWAVGIIPGAFSILFMIVIALIGLFTPIDEWLPPPLSWLFDPLATLVVPALSYLAGSLTSVAMRRRDDRLIGGAGRRQAR